MLLAAKSPHDLSKLYIHHLLEERHDAATAYGHLEEIINTADHSSWDGVAQLCEAILTRASLVVRLEAGTDVEAAYIDLVKRVLDSGLLLVQFGDGAQNQLHPGLSAAMDQAGLFVFNLNPPPPLLKMAFSLLEKTPSIHVINN